MTKVITSKDIRRAFTEKVSEYLAQGMEISVRTMSGSQDEVGKVDLTDGKFIYRVRLDRESKMFDEDFFYGYCDAIELTVEKFEDDGKNEFDTWGHFGAVRGNSLRRIRGIPSIEIRPLLLTAWKKWGVSLRFVPREERAGAKRTR